MSYDCTLRDKDKSDIADSAIDLLTDKTNRAVHQTKFLYNLLGDWSMLLELEEALKTFYVSGCPGDMAECYYWILKLRVWKVCGYIPERSEYTYL